MDSSEASSGFWRNVHALARNPLGIVAVFIVLVYGIGALLLGATSTELEFPERIVLVAFLASFPFAVLRTFFVLVKNHHWKLYAPSDFRDDSFKELTEAERTVRKDAEIAAIGQEGVKALSRTETLLLPSAAVDAPLDRAQFRNFLTEAEDLAFERLSREYGVTFRRDVRVSGSQLAIFDGVAETTEKIIVAEVRLLPSKIVSTYLARETLARAAAAAERVSMWANRKPLELALALVVSELDEGDADRIRRAASASMEQIMPFRIHVFSLRELREAHL